ncbi:MAG: hypothetical protein J0J04_07535 [Microbacterium sp.]|uniref:hypothetical protein n=1 Tax=Microbacterium sp. TaxID=51671 RepID=UPI001AC79132|nr:hypothetical protein [Microbacterium sp.]MBN9214649.1 hypothetical protein [Microbacterium sp.]
MSAFNETLHPRGQAANPGQFKAKANAAPAADLTVPVADQLDELRDHFTQAHAEAVETEMATWFAFALEQHGEGSDALYFDFEAEEYEGGERFHAVFGPDGQIEDDNIIEAIPSWLGTGDGVVQYVDGEYKTELGDRDGQSKFVSVDVGPRKGRAALRELGQAATQHRATMRDTAEMLAIAGALDRASVIIDGDEATFTPAMNAGIRCLRHEESGHFIGAGDEVESAAFGFYGQGVQSVRVARGSDGTFTIDRTVIAPISGTVSVLTDVVDGQPKRWSAGGL